MANLLHHFLTLVSASTVAVKQVTTSIKTVLSIDIIVLTTCV